MAKHSLNDFNVTINLPFSHYELLLSSLAKIEALIHVALAGEFKLLTPYIIYHYLLAISDFIQKAVDICFNVTPHRSN